MTPPTPRRCVHAADGPFRRPTQRSCLPALRLTERAAPPPSRVPAPGAPFLGRAVGPARLIVGFVLAACGGDSMGPEIEGENVVASVRMVGARVAVELGAQHQARAEPLTADGRVLDREVSWAVRDPGIASVNGAGELRALALGATVLTATSEGVTATADVEVVATGSVATAACEYVGPGPESHVHPFAAEATTGELRAVMLFADFPDAPASEATRPLYDLMVPRAREWFEEVSGARLSLTVDAVHQWFRAPAESGTYDATTYAGHERYISDVASLADPITDFSPYDAIFIVASDRSRQALSYANPSFRFRLDGVEIRAGVTFGTDVRNSIPADYGAHVMVHETGHLIGLPDLYRYGAGTFEASTAAVGLWDIMSWTGGGAHVLAWHKWKLEWMDDDRIDCLGDASVERTVEPFDAASGRQALVIPLTGPRLFVVEARRARGFDGRLCEEGVIGYTVDVSVSGGSDPIRVRSARSDRDPALAAGRSCGPLYESSFGVGSGRISAFFDPGAGLSMEVLEDLGDGYRVRVNRY